MGGKAGSEGTLAAQLLQGESQKELKFGRPLRALVQQQGFEVAQTGGPPTAQLPLVARVLEQVLRGGSQARLQTERDITSAGIFRTPQGQRILADQALEARIAAVTVPSTVAQSILDRGLTAAGAGLQVGIGGQGPAVQSQASIQASQIRADADVLAGIFNAIGNDSSELPTPYYWAWCLGST